VAEEAGGDQGGAELRVGDQGGAEADQGQGLPG
jgi:hypothetical protein